MIWENIRLAMRDLGANKLRTFLSLLGIVIGVGSVIAITTLGQSATLDIQSQIALVGLETITVFPGRNIGQARDLMTEELGDRLRNAIDGIEAVAPTQSSQVRVSFGRDTISAPLVAAGPAWGDVFDYAPEAGSFISAEDEARRSLTVILGAEVADDLFGDEIASQEIVGSLVRLRIGEAVRSFRVGGVMAPKDASIGVSFDDRVYLPYATWTERLARVRTVGSYSIGTLPGVDVVAVAEEIETWFAAFTGIDDAVRVISPATIAETFNSVTETLNLFLAGIAAISLLVGGIGIMNIMLVAVIERTREIGIRKALGATPGAIRGQFLTEAVTLTVVGGLIGVAFGMGLSRLAVSAMDITFAPAWWAVGLSVGVSAAIGLFFGLYPAWRASTLDPVKALSYE